MPKIGLIGHRASAICVAIMGDSLTGTDILGHLDKTVVTAINIETDRGTVPTVECKDATDYIPKMIEEFAISALPAISQFHDENYSKESRKPWCPLKFNKRGRVKR